VAQVVEHLPSKHEALSSNPNTTKNNYNIIYTNKISSFTSHQTYGITFIEYVPSCQSTRQKGICILKS
jgi:hypothetical protein